MLDPAVDRRMVDVIPRPAIISFRFRRLRSKPVATASPATSVHANKKPAISAGFSVSNSSPA